MDAPRMASPVYIANSGMINSIGYDAPFVHAVYHTGLSAYAFGNHMTRDHHLIKLAPVPDGAIETLIEEISPSEGLRLRDRRILAMARSALSDVLQEYEGPPVPLLLSGPENYTGIDNQLDRSFLQVLAAHEDLPIDYVSSRVNSMGRAGVISDLRLASHYLHERKCPYVLLGGVDSGQHDVWLKRMDADSRLITERPGPQDGFVPGDGAAFLLLTSDRTKSLRTGTYCFRLGEPGVAEELGHLYSSEPYRGEGLDRAVKEALRSVPEEMSVTRLYSSANGESHWAKELGVAMTRSMQRFRELQHLHPADCYGDLGAATGATLIALAHADGLMAQVPEPMLVTTSSDYQYRTAVCLIPERTSP